MATLKSYADEVKGTIIDALECTLKGVTILTSAEENAEDEWVREIPTNLVRIFFEWSKN